MKNIKKIKNINDGKKTNENKNYEFLIKKGKKAVTGCPEL